MRKGYYLTIDITIALALVIIIVTIFMMSFATLPASRMEKVASQRFGESILYTLKNNGALDSIVYLLDAGNINHAKIEAIEELKKMRLDGGIRLDIYTYDSSMNSVHNFTLGYGAITRESFSASLVFKPNTGQSTYGIAVIYIGS